jgi:hypothetical protein
MDVVTAPMAGLAVRRRWVNGASQFVGAIDGRECVCSPTFEGAVQALLRRACHAVVH